MNDRQRLPAVDPRTLAGWAAGARSFASTWRGWCRSTSGETEKHVAELFERAEREGWVLVP